MKSEITKFTICCIIVLFAACSQKESLKPAFLETMEKVELRKEESLSRTLTGLTKSQANSRTALADYGTLDLDKIYKRIASEEQLYPNYMIRLYPPEGVHNSLEYLVMIGTEYGFRGYIFQYQTTPEHINSIADPKIYTGYINILDLNRELLAQKYYYEGKENNNINHRSTNAINSGCTCSYHWEEEMAIGDILGEEIGTGYYTLVIECQCLGDPGSDNGAGGIGDPMPDPDYDPSNPDAGDGGGSGSGDSEPDGITRDPVGTVKEVDCIGGYVKNSDGQCILEEEYIIGEIEKKLEFNPYALLEIDCDQIAKWQELTQNEASDAIKNKINALQSQNTDWDDDWAIQSLNGAGGTIVNMDYFAVNVTDLPNNPATGNQFTPEGFLDYFRRNIDDFADQSLLGSSFGPYCEIPSICTQETNLWNSNDPTGALVYIDIPGDDGVVVCSEYTPSYWYFMTLEAPGAGNHPVSGTRQFGFEAKPSRSGTSYEFFVRGVDRFDNNLIENTLYMINTPANPSNPNPFFGADALWESVQSNLNKFINDETNGGSSTINTPVKNRTDWEKIMDVLEGKSAISDLGCS
jgi:hypothetical protein